MRFGLVWARGEGGVYEHGRLVLLRLSDLWSSATFVNVWSVGNYKSLRVLQPSIS